MEIQNKVFIEELYTITDKPLRSEHYTQAEIDTIERFGQLAHKPKIRKELIPQLEKAIKEYPHLPSLKNYLYIFYSKNEQKEKAIELMYQTLAEHPDYFFGKITLACHYITTNELDKIESVVVEIGNIHAMAPEKKVYHITEVVGYIRFIIEYYSKVDDIDGMLNAIYQLRDFARTFPAAKEAFSHYKKTITMLELRKSVKLLQERNKDQRTVVSTFKSFFEPTEEAPVFTHPEIQHLYQYGYDIPKEIIEAILLLPRPTLIADLELALADAQKRFTYYQTLVSTAGDEKYEDDLIGISPLHAIALLTELKASDSLQAVLNLFRQDQDFSEFWFGDEMTERLFYFIYHLGKSNLEALQNYVLEEENYTWSRVAVIDAIFQIGIKHPEQRDEVIQCYRMLLEHFITHHENTKLIDSTVIAKVIGVAADLKAAELLPLCKTAYDLKIVDEMMYGNYQTIEREMLDTYGQVNVLKDLTIFEFYEKSSEYDICERVGEENPEKVKQREEIFKNSFFEDSNDDDEDDFYPTSSITPLIAPKKYGRNDKVSVRYKDGRFLRDVKFKKIEDDYTDGLCVIE